MNLMPMLLAAGEQATLVATPIVRRLDLVFPMADRSNTTRTDQYLLRATVVCDIRGGSSVTRLVSVLVFCRKQ